VTQADKATVIEVAEGSEINNIDIVMVAPPSTFTVSGRVIDGETGKPLPGITFELQYTEGNNSVSGPSMVRTNGSGEFKLQDLAPGSYTLYAALPENSDARVDPLTFDVVDRDLTGLEMKSKKGASLSGMVVVEGSPERSVTRNEMHVFAWIESPSPVGSRSTKVNADGSFKLSGLAPGKAQVSLAINDPRESMRFQVLRVEHNGVPQRSGININEGEQVDGVRLVVKYVKATGAIRGQVKVENGELPPSARITLWAFAVGENLPTEQQTVPAEMDSRGRFLLENLAAGTYELQGSVLGPNQRYEITKQLVTVNDNAVTEVTVTFKLKP
jgi:Carboxypeptidase regulatory-like domain